MFRSLKIFSAPVAVAALVAGLSNGVAIEMALQLVQSQQITDTQFSNFLLRLLFNAIVTMWLFIMIALYIRRTKEAEQSKEAEQKKKATYTNLETKLNNALWLDHVLQLHTDPKTDSSIMPKSLNVFVVSWWDKITSYLPNDRQVTLLKYIISKYLNDQVPMGERLGYLGSGIFYCTHSSQLDANFYDAVDITFDEIDIHISSMTYNLERDSSSYQISNIARTYIKNVEQGIDYAENIGSVTRSESSSNPQAWRAIIEHRISFNFQPIFCLKTGELNGFEMLLRLYDQNNTLLPLNTEVASLIENSPISIQFHKILFEKLTAFQRRLDQIMPQKKISINLPAPVLVRPQFAKLITSAIDNGLDLSRVAFELTERTLPARSQAVKKGLYELTGLGAAIHLDDFGAGQSSVETISAYDFDVIKIDRVFLNSREWDVSSAKVLIEFLKSSGSKILVEGVEETAMATTFEQAGADYVQGFAFGKPMTEDEAIAFAF